MGRIARQGQYGVNQQFQFQPMPVGAIGQRINQKWPVGTHDRQALQPPLAARDRIKAHDWLLAEFLQRRRQGREHARKQRLGMMLPIIGIDVIKIGFCQRLQGGFGKITVIGGDCLGKGLARGQ